MRHGILAANRRRGGGGGGGGGETFDPASLFAGGAAGAWYDPSDLATLFQDSAGTVAAAVDAPVGRVNDKSGNGHHLVQAAAGARPMLRQAGGVTYLEFDGVDDGLTPAVAMSWPASADLAVAIHNSSGDGGWLTAYGSSGAFLGVAQLGNGGGTHSGLGTADLVNGATVSPATRDALHVAIGASARVYQGVGTNMGGFGNLYLGAYPGFEFGGRIHGVIIAPAMSVADRAKVRSWLGAKAGIVL